MNLKKTLATIVLVGAMALGVAGKSNSSPILYEDFSSGTLNSAKWDVIPGMDEGFVNNENGNYVFHTQQNTLAYRETYLVPKKQFTTGDIFEYEQNVVSKEGSYMTMAPLTGSQDIRIGINGFWSGSVQGYDELGVAHIRFEFQENNLALRRESPLGAVFFDNLHLNNSNGTYKLYIGAISGPDGRGHTDFDNFYTDVVPEPATLSLVALGGLASLISRRRKG